MLVFLAIHLSRIARAFGTEMRSLPIPGPRMIDEAECICSVLLAIVLSHAIGAENVGWAAFSGYMVMRSHVAESFTRGILRVIGTLAGAGLALAAAPLLLRQPVLLSLGLLIGGGVTLYFAIVGRRAYAWLFTGLTFLMVLIEGMEHAREPILRFASTRVLEVLAGTTACVIVSAISTWTVRRALPNPDNNLRAKPVDQPTRQWHATVARHALVGGIALALIPWAWQWLGIPSLSQSSITIFAVMLVPAASLADGMLSPVSSRMMNRLVGCLAGGLLASAILLVSRHSPVVMTIGLALGVMIGRHIENGPPSMSYAGLQFTLAFLVVLVPDNYANAALEPGYDRLFGILFGMVLLEPVVLAAHLIARRGLKGTPAKPAAGLAEK
ncbi:FUSC family protein [Tardiphaga sp. 804_B3_N1_9]|uniref:FUSC family protein n=1 Tax=Tardiphaga TaxID=1395974 RepID=UPI001586172C|nr:FUSC family protein [Tardiphaga robiniae]NUU44787.1 FUSC family protein [Tardiphaga robiniae]